MILKDTIDPLGLSLAKTDEDITIIMGISPVIFGYRIRAGYYNNYYYHLDWCAGNDAVEINLLYSMCYWCLTKRNKNNPFISLPSNSKIKPFYNDENFKKLINEDLSNMEFSIVSKITSQELQLIKLIKIKKHERNKK